MNKPAVDKLLPAILVTAAVGALGVWLSVGRVEHLEARVPGLDGVPGPEAADLEPSPQPGKPVRGEGVASQATGSWPCFRGPRRDGIAHDATPLARTWPAGRPDVLWTVELGPGHAGAAIAGGCVFVLDYDPQAEADTMRCLSLDDGREIWHNSYPTVVVENHGMSRTVPAVEGKYVVSLGPKCYVAAWDVATGECLWLIDLVRDFGATVPNWYAGQCPLVEDGRVILAPSGNALLIAVDIASGELIWQSPKVRNWEMTHVSILPMEFAGSRMYVYCGSGGVAGISAEDGSLLWQSNEWVGNMATCPTPVDLGDGRLFFSSGYAAGALMMELKPEGNRFRAESLFRLKPRQFESEQHTPIFYQGHLYGVRTKVGGEQLVCLDLDGNEVWNSGTDKFGRGPYMIADDLILVMDDRGLLTMVEATPDGYHRRARFQAIEHGQDAWAPMALARGRLVLRDLTRMVCFNLAKP